MGAAKFVGEPEYCRIGTRNGPRRARGAFRVGYFGRRGSSDRPVRRLPTVGVLHVELEFPDGGRSIETRPDAEPLSVLAKLEACREQSVVRNELGLAKGDCGVGRGRGSAGYGYCPNGGDAA